jgi:hypothetical protein
MIEIRAVFNFVEGVDQGFKHRCHEKGCQSCGQTPISRARASQLAWKGNRECIERVPWSAFIKPSQSYEIGLDADFYACIRFSFESKSVV